MIRTVNVVRYITPLREGGSLPAIAEADDEFIYVLKFRGAGQGPKALIAELLGGEIARAIGLRVPEIVFAELDEGFGRMERDEEIQDLLKFSVGLNLGLHYLTGAISFDPTVHSIDARQASLIVWLDCFLMNMDRTAKNTNMLIWHKDLWLIDHGASLYFHHGNQDWQILAKSPFSLIKDHVLLKQATELSAIDENLKSILTDVIISDIVSRIPEKWLDENVPFEQQKAKYIDYFSTRLANTSIFVNEADHAREVLI